MVAVPNFSQNFEGYQHLAVGLSGGGDSMALCHMLCEWGQANGVTIHAITVDHGLRNESAAEALQVRQWVQNFSNLHHVILTCEWPDGAPETAIMERARQVRYELMANYCAQKKIKTLCVAHHGDDQLETFFFRLAKGSGLDGLCGISEMSDFAGVQIFRPLLSCSHEDLIAYCMQNDLNWVEDPSNENTHYARPRLRQALSREGFDVRRFTKTLERFRRGKDALEWLALDVLEKVTEKEGEYDYTLLKAYPIDIQIRVLKDIVERVGQVTHQYPAKLERIEDIVMTGVKPLKSATLHGCLLSCSKDGKTLFVTKRV